MGFSRQKYWSRLPFSSPEDLPNPGINGMVKGWNKTLGRKPCPRENRWSIFNYTAFTVDLLILSYKVAYGIVMRELNPEVTGSLEHSCPVYWITSNTCMCFVLAFFYFQVTCFIFIIAVGWGTKAVPPKACRINTAAQHKQCIHKTHPLPLSTEAPNPFYMGILKLSWPAEFP